MIRPERSAIHGGSRKPEDDRDHVASSHRTHYRPKRPAQHIAGKPLDPNAILPIQPWETVVGHIRELLQSRGIHIAPGAHKHSKGAANEDPPSGTTLFTKIDGGDESSDNTDDDEDEQNDDNVKDEDGIEDTGHEDLSETPLVADSHASLGSPDPESTLSTTITTNPPSNPSTVLPITIPHGFQSMRRLYHPHSSLRSIVHIPATGSAEMVLTLDANTVSMWRGAARVKRISTALPGTSLGLAAGVETGAATATGVVAVAAAGAANISNGTPEGKGANAGVVGLSHWIYVEELKVLLIASSQLQLRVLDNFLEEMSCVSCPKPILAMEYISDREELVTAEVGTIRVWKIKKTATIHRTIITLSERLAIIDLLDDEWVVRVLYDRTLDRLFAAVDGNVYIYDMASGERLDALRNIHDMSITCLAYYEPLEYLLTAGKDGRIRVWNFQNCLLQDFRDHFHAVTALALVETGCQATPGTIPIVISSSLDGTIRMWNFETGICLY
ncbi:WD40-repeat-containing domain protein, partial [Blyttiomyces helicus]